MTNKRSEMNDQGTDSCQPPGSHEEVVVYIANMPDSKVVVAPRLRMPTRIIEQLAVGAQTALYSVKRDRAVLIHDST